MSSSSSRNQNTTCAYPSCTRRVWQAPDGSLSSFCGTTHRDAMASQVSPEFLCKFCRQKPVYIENGYAHDYCGKYCASASRSGQRPPRSRSVPPRPTPSTGICRLAGCEKPVYVNEHGIASEWCSNRHRIKAVQTGKAEACLFCRKYPKILVNGKQSDFCSQQCGKDTISAAPIILQVPKTHTAYENVTSQFKTQWLHDVPIPTVREVWKIYGPADMTDRFMKYKLSVERRIGQLGGNSRRRWHGTARMCRLGDGDSETQFCNYPNCSLCSIIQTSFDKAEYGKRTNWGRFGRGIYASATSSKANDYIVTQRSAFKAMLLAEIVMGHTVKLTTDCPSLTQPPSGFDSVVGEPGDDLNYDESIVYRNDAIRPLFLVIFEDGIPEKYARAQR